MNKQEYIDVHGKIKYIHAVNFNKFGKWAITFYPDQKGLEVIRDLQTEGVKNTFKKDEDNQYFIQFSREPTKMMRGKVVAFTAPKVIIKKEDGTTEPMDGTKVGWGSDATIRLDVYYHPTPSGGKARAARWDSVRIDNLVPFVPDRSDLSDSEMEAVKSLGAAKEPEPW